MQFVKAKAENCFVKMFLWGAAGSGKTLTSLRIANRLESITKKPTLVIDTETGSSKKYANRVDFFVYEPTHFSLTNIESAIKEAIKKDFGQIIIDSISHLWCGSGGVLESVEKLGTGFTGWKKITPILNSFITLLVSSPVNVIATGRAKTQYEVEKTETGKTTVKKLGLGPIFREGLEYEFDVVCSLDEGLLSVQKTRFPELKNYTKMEEDGSIVDVIASSIGLAKKS